MSAGNHDPTASAALKPLEVASYLRVHGWRQEVDLDGKAGVRVLPATPDRQEADVTLPLRRDLADFSLRMREVVRILAQVERRNEGQVIQDLLATGSDVIRVRAPSRDAASGSLPLAEAVAFVEHSRDMMLAAACAAVDKRAYFPTRKPTKATEYLEQVRMGQTERGSYVLTILSPVAPALVSNTELPLDLPPLDPYERQVTRTLAESLAALEAATRDAASSGDTGAFERTVQRGVSANLCEAVAGLSAISPGEGLDIGITWSRTRAAADNKPFRVVLGSDTIPLIREAAMRFKATAPVQDAEIQGFVTGLKRGAPDGPGDTVLEGVVDGELRRCAVRLEEADYAQAQEAHRDWIRVTCTGELIKEGRGHRLRYPQHFRLIPSDEGS